MEWLTAEGLGDHLQKEEDVDGWAVYRCVAKPAAPSGESWTKAYHGSYVLVLGLVGASERDAGRTAR